MNFLPFGQKKAPSVLSTIPFYISYVDAFKPKKWPQNIQTARIGQCPNIADALKFLTSNCFQRQQNLISILINISSLDNFDVFAIKRQLDVMFPKRKIVIVFDSHSESCIMWKLKNSDFRYLIVLKSEISFDFIYEFVVKNVDANFDGEKIK